MKFDDKTKTIVSSDGLFIVDKDFDDEAVDFSSMLPENEEPSKKQGKTSLEKMVNFQEPKDVILINGEEFLGKITSFRVFENKITGEKVVKVTLKS